MKIESMNVNVSEFIEKTDQYSNIEGEKIAIIGMAVRAAGSDNVEEFWNNIKSGRDMIRRLPPNRADATRKYLHYIGEQGSNQKFSQAGYLERIDEFDYDFFKILPKEAELMDPNQRIFLQTAWEAMEDAGYCPKKLNGSKTGVYVGFGDDSDYMEMVSHVDEKNIDIAKTGNLRPIIAARLSYILNLKGPNMIIDTTCSSSLVAVHIAVQALNNNDCDMAFVGGIKISVLPNKNSSNIGVESQTGKIRTFDDAADGTALGEGVGVLVLKRLKDAVTDGDSIYGIIRGSGINQDGKSAGITAPNQSSQEELLYNTWRKCDIEPEMINYIEAHGTGTKLGDPIELAGIKKAIERFTEKKQFCAIGSVKANIGHAVHAAGIISIIKVLLMLRENIMPMLCNFSIPNRNTNFADSPLYINDELRPLYKAGERVICSVSSFGVSGTNAHVIIEKNEYCNGRKQNTGNKYNILSLSAKSKESLMWLIGKYIENFEQIKNYGIGDFCYTANACREHYNFRIAIVFKDYLELLCKLKEIKSDNLTGVQIKSNEHIKVVNSGKYDDLIKICGLYIDGSYIDWDFFYKNSQYSTVHLPTYPFLKTRCWINIPDDTHGNNEEINVRQEVEFAIDEKIRLSGRNSGEYPYMERVLATILKNLMGYEQFDIDENFGSMGGDSILLTKFCSMLNSVIETEILLADIFSHPTIRKLSEFLSCNKVNEKESNAFKTAETDELDIAIIGMSARMPEAENIEEYWKNIESGKECIIPLDKERRKRCIEYLKFAGKYSDDIEFSQGGYMKDIESFDYKFFNISPKEAGLMDPHQRLFLQESWKAIEDAGYAPYSLSGSNTGVFLGYTNDFRFSYWDMVTEADKENYKIAVAPNVTSIIPTRISYLLNLRGPSISVDTACSSSLVAIHMACASLLAGECSMAIAGGVRVNLMPIFEVENGMRLESPKFQARAFDSLADGTVWGEGVAAIILKPLKKALEDNDHVYAVIKSSTANQDGASLGITTPNPEAQTDLITKCWEKAKIDPTTIQYIECHGTGTALGDPMEITGINNAFQKYTTKKQLCGIGSIKSSIGHLDAVSGLASVIKLVCSLNHGVLPRSLNFEYPNEKADFANSSVYVVDSNRQWTTTGFPRRCAVSAFGFSGTNCHLLLEEAPIQKHSAQSKMYIFALSAKSVDSMENLIEKYLCYIKQNSDINISDLCYTATCGRNHYAYRFALCVENVEDLKKKLRSIANGDKEQYKITENISYSKEELNAYINLAISNTSERKIYLDKIAQLYAQGAEVDWIRLFSDAQYYRISAPTYEFEKNRCWLEFSQRRAANDVTQIVEEYIQSHDLNETVKSEFSKMLDELGYDRSENALNETKKVHLTGKDEFTQLEYEVGEIWGKVLGLNDINVNDKFYELGGHSIAMMQIVSEINSKLKIELSYNDFNDCETVLNLAEMLEKKEPKVSKGKYPVVIPDYKNVHKNFPITDIQMSYLLGRRDTFEMGGVCTHLYMEIETTLDIGKLENSLNKIIDRHPMLRAVVNENGTQHILEKNPRFKIDVVDLSQISEEKQKEYIAKERAEISHHVFKADQWPLMGVTAIKISAKIHYLFIEFDMLIADGSSLQIIGNDWISYYKNPNVTLPELNLTFRDYMLGLQSMKSMDIYKADKEYWEKRLDTFPKAPKLNYKVEPSSVIKPHFARLSKTFSVEEWKIIKGVSQQMNVSASSLLCAAFAEVLAYWSNQQEFAINFTVFNRYPFHQDVDNIIGDFTSVMLIAINLEPDSSFWDRAKAIQKEVLISLEHRHYDGVEFIRKLAARDNRIGEPIMPIVFTSMLFNGEKDPWSEFGETKLGLSQTPQVFLDHQAGEIGGQLLINWDYVENIFDKTMIEEMFNQYTGILQYLITLESEEK